MKFNKIFIEKSITNAVGIHEINIGRLSNVISLVGKNGSGKTRILDLIETHLFNQFTLENLFDGSVSSPPIEMTAILEEFQIFRDYFINVSEIRELNQRLAKNPKDRHLIKQFASLNKKLNGFQPFLTKHGPELTALNARFQGVRDFLQQKLFRRINNLQIRGLQPIFEQQASDFPFEQLISATSDLGAYNELSSIYQTGLDFISGLAHQLALDRMESLGNQKKFNSKISSQRFLALKKLILDFLNKNLTWETKKGEQMLRQTDVQAVYAGIWKLDGREFNYQELSDGEKTLFAYALLFFLLDQNPQLNIRESIVLIDEPELHLHPDSEIELIEGIRRTIGEKGQLIIATHSINILSTLNYDEIFCVKAGSIQHPTRDTPGDSLEQLMRISERVDKLSDFLTSISTWTYVNFITQCFEHPEVIQSAGRKDIQIEAFRKAISDNSNSDNCLLLDFGAGKGRVYEQLKSDEGFLTNIKYQALEPDVEHHGVLNSLGVDKIYDHYSKLEDKTFHFVLLCNVLHEIEIQEWEQCLKKVVASLKPNGFLVVIEAKTLSKGEKIGTTGFVLLDRSELKELFGLISEPALISVGANSDKIICALIRKPRIKEISKRTILAALDLLETNTLKKIKALREIDDTKPNYELGRKLAFLSQQHINARLGQELLKDGR